MSQDRQTLPYDPQATEARWQARWAATGIYRTPILDVGGKESQAEQRPTFYCLDFFPYPSGAGLSVGHGRRCSLPHQHRLHPLSHHDQRPVSFF